jgi:hypothetical protein
MYLCGSIRHGRLSSRKSGAQAIAKPASRQSQILKENFAVFSALNWIAILIDFRL